jgi:plastocyanin
VEAERPTCRPAISRTPLVLRALGLALALGALGSAGCESPPEIPGTEPARDAPDVVERITRPVDGGEVHLVRLGHRGDAYRADPDQITISAGDAVRFIMAGQQPESIVFDPVEASPEAADYIRAHALHLGVLMTDPGETFDVVFRDAPPGTYPFRSLPHGDRGMRGTVTLTP